jgi:two-component system, sensor histidine kinase LadS
MRWSALAAFALGLIFIAEGARAELGSAVLIADVDRGQISANAHFWHEKPGQVSIEQASAPSAAARFMPLQDETMFELKPKDRLWIRIDIDRKAVGQEHVVLWSPLPLLDSITLYQQGGSGKWQASVAGDRVAVSDWPEPGRYPRFHLDLPPGKSSVYLQVQGSTPVSIPLHIGTEAQAQAADRKGFLGMGAVSGLLLTLMLICFVTAYTYRDQLYLYYGLYMLFVILAVGAYTGVSAYLLWDDSPVWADLAQGFLAILSVGGALYFIEAMLGGRQFAHRLSGALLSLAALSVPLAAVYVFVSRSTGVIVMGAYILTVSFIGLSLAARAWRRGDQVGKWVFFAYAPLAAAVLLALARAYGWINVSWVVQYGVVVALMLEAPLMMVAIHVRSRDRHEINTREHAMNTQDALTGLLKEHIFDDRIKQTLQRFAKRREDAAVVLISLVNYQSIAEAYGLPVAEQSVLRSVIKLRKVLRDVETVARVGTSQFGLILEGMSDRSRITEIGARLIAQGLMPLPGLTPEVTLHFHLASVVLREMPAPDPNVKQELQTMLASMSPRTRRPIRFLEALTTGGSPLSASTAATSAVDMLQARVEAAVQTDNMAYAPTAHDSSGSQWDSSAGQGKSFTGDTVILPR